MAMDNGNLIVDLPIKVVMFNSYAAVYQRVSVCTWVNQLPVVPHKAVAEVSKIGNL